MADESISEVGGLCIVGSCDKVAAINGKCLQHADFKEVSRRAKKEALKKVVGGRQVFLYAIHARGTDHVKFGIAKDVDRRLADLQVSNGHELQVLAVLPCRAKAEQYVHQYLAAGHIRGEWHHLDQQSKIVIEWMRKGDYLGLLRLIR